MTFYLITGLKAIGPSDHGLKPSAKISLSSFKLIYLKYFVTEMESEHLCYTLRSMGNGEYVWLSWILLPRPTALGGAGRLCPAGLACGRLPRKL